MRYAQTTLVSVDRSKAEIERLLSRYGADQFVSGWADGGAKVAFHAHDKFIRFMLPLPDKTDDEFTKTPSGRRRLSPEKAARAYEQGCRQRYRALALVVKAKLEAVETGITTFEEEFLAHIVMPDGKTIAEHTLPAIEAAYKGGKMPKALLPGW